MTAEDMQDSAEDFSRVRRRPPMPGQRFQNFVRRRFGRRLALRVFFWRLRRALRHGAEVERREA